MKNCVHFVGFRGDEYNSAVKVFGPPDFVHFHLDRRALADFAPGDTVVFGPAAKPDRVIPFPFDDSNQTPGDPAAQERRKH